MKVTILTVSDRCFFEGIEDKSGPAIQEFLRNSKTISCEVVDLKCSPDVKESIQKVLLTWCDELKIDLAITTGGTGLAPRDVTPEAVKEILEKDAPGLAMAMLIESLKITQFAMLSRSVCGSRGKTLIITLPGSSKGAVECLSVVAPVLSHAIDLLQDEKGKVAVTHLEAHKHCNEKAFKDDISDEESNIVSKADVSKVARRARKSPYELISVEEARLKVISCALETATICLNFTDALGFVLSEDVYALEQLPPFPASIKDGYAVISADKDGARFVIGQSYSGSSPHLPVLESGYCMRINTGAPLPPGADSVVQVEDTEVVEENEEGTEELKIRVLKAPNVGLDIRTTGSDISKGELLFQNGTVIGPAEMGVLASAGVFNILVYKKPVVAILSTGNELQDASTAPLKEGHIYDSNKVALISLLRQFSIPYFDAGIAKDDQTCLLKGIRKSFRHADILVTSGGVSMGERDLLRPVLITDLGAKIHFAQVFMKPGKPTTFASCTFKGRTKLILGLPGNPVSAIVTAHLYLLPLCRKLSGHVNYQNTVIQAKLASTVCLDHRPEYQRVTLAWSTSENLPTAYSTGNQISSRLLSCVSAQALLRLPPASKDIKNLPIGSVVDAILLSL